MRNFLKIGEVNVMPLLLSIQRQPELWNRHRQRKEAANGIHAEMDDIWLRYNDYRPYEAMGSWLSFNDEHDSVWYKEYYALPEVRPIVFNLMAQTQAERLGGVLITRIPPGGVIKPHADVGWHVDYYDKFYVTLQGHPMQEFWCDEEVISPRQGEVWWFDNRKMHHVENKSTEDRMTLIICLRLNRHLQGEAP